MATEVLQQALLRMDGVAPAARRGPPRRGRAGQADECPHDLVPVQDGRRGDPESAVAFPAEGFSTPDGVARGLPQGGMIQSLLQQRRRGR